MTIATAPPSFIQGGRSYRARTAGRIKLASRLRRSTQTTHRPALDEVLVALAHMTPAARITRLAAAALGHAQEALQPVFHHYGQAIESPVTSMADHIRAGRF